MLQHLSHECHHFDDEVASAVALTMHLWMLSQPEHHLDNHEPDLLLGSQNFVRMALNHLHEDLEDAFEERNVFALSRDKDL